MQCPDPHFKKKHHKRRVLQKPLVGAIVDNLTPGGQVYFLHALVYLYFSFDRSSLWKFKFTLYAIVK